MNIENKCDCTPQNKTLADSVAHKLPNSKTTNKLTDFFKIMGDSTRMKLLLSLSQNELCVSDLAYILNMTRSAISHQLSELKEAKLIKSRRDGKLIFYSLDDDHINDIVKKSLEHVQEV